MARALNKSSYPDVKDIPFLAGNPLLISALGCLKIDIETWGIGCDLRDGAIKCHVQNQYFPIRLSYPLQLLLHEICNLHGQVLTQLV